MSRLRVGRDGLELECEKHRYCSTRCEYLKEKGGPGAYVCFTPERCCYCGKRLETETGLMNWDEIRPKLQALFPGVQFYSTPPWGDNDPLTTSFSITAFDKPRDHRFNASSLFGACELLKCKPEELFGGWDASNCYYAGDVPDFYLEVRRSR